MRRRWRRLTTVGAVAAGSLAIVAGHAASLGGLTAGGLVSIGQNATVPVPSIIGCDSFTGTTGASMNGRAATVAAACSNRVWTAHVGTWSIQSNAAASSTTTSAVATLNTGTTSSTARVVLSNLNTSGRSGGVVISHNGTSTYVAAVMIDGAPDRVELRIYSAGIGTVVATYNPTFATTNTLQLSRSTAVITSTLNGIAIGAYTLTSLQQTTLGIGSRAGLFGGNSSVRFDDFAVTTP